VMWWSLDQDLDATSDEVGAVVATAAPPPLQQLQTQLQRRAVPQVPFHMPADPDAKAVQADANPIPDDSPHSPPSASPSTGLAVAEFPASSLTSKSSASLGLFSSLPSTSQATSSPGIPSSSIPGSQVTSLETPSSPSSRPHETTTTTTTTSHGLRPSSLFSSLLSQPSHAAALDPPPAQGLSAARTNPSHSSECPMIGTPPAWMTEIQQEVLAKPGLVPYVASKRKRCSSTTMLMTTTTTPSPHPITLPDTPVGNVVLIQCPGLSHCTESWQAFTCTPDRGWSPGSSCYGKFSTHKIGEREYSMCTWQGQL
jgi:hypothetical protein